MQQSFNWHGINQQGEKQTGEINTTNKQSALAELQQQHIVVTRINRASRIELSFAKKISSLDIIVFTRTLATLIDANLPLTKALLIIGQEHPKKTMNHLITSITNDINRGALFSQALQKHPKHFNTIYISLIQSAEQTGQLNMMLLEVAKYLEKTEKLKKKIKKALNYPIAIISITSIIATLLLIFVVPQFKTLFDTYHAKLPVFTQSVLTISRIIQDQWWLLSSGLVLLGTALVSARHYSAKFNTFSDRLILTIPLFGILIKKAITARVLHTLSINLTASVPLHQSLDAVIKISNNLIFQNAILNIKQDINSGKTLSESFSATQLFAPMVVQMINAGEQSGSLNIMLDKVASYYQDDVDTMVDNFSNLIEPLIMVFLGVIIGGFVLAMYLPIFKLGSIF